MKKFPLHLCFLSVGGLKDSVSQHTPLYQLMVISTRLMAINITFKLTTTKWIPQSQPLPTLQTHISNFPFAWKKSQAEHVQNQTLEVLVPIKFTSFWVYLILTNANSILADIHKTPKTSCLHTSLIVPHSIHWQVLARLLHSLPRIWLLLCTSTAITLVQANIVAHLGY